MAKRERIQIGVDGNVCRTACGWLVADIPSKKDGLAVASFTPMPSDVVGEYYISNLRFKKKPKPYGSDALVLYGNDACQVLNKHKKKISLD